MNGEDLDSDASKSSGKFLIPGGLPPGFTGVFSAAGGHWSESEQKKLNEFFRHWLEMLKAEMAEKQKTIIEIAERLDLHDEKIADRVSSDEYQSLLRKGFRDWSGTESEQKRILVRNILSNAGAARVVSDDVVRLFMDWVKMYSEFHFEVVSKIFNNSGITRGEVWDALGRSPVREDSADADLFKLLFRDLSTGGIIRQHRDTDFHGNYIAKTPNRRGPRQVGARPMKSAFDGTDQYELTALGQQFIHYAMTDLPLKISYSAAAE